MMSGLPSDSQLLTASLADAFAEMQDKIDSQAALIRKQQGVIEHNRKIFDRSSAAAGIGLWECTLADQSLAWTDVVYDIFDLPRGSVLDRAEIVKCYSADSVRELHQRRSQAIEERTGFRLDAEIVTAKGNRRWVRITATVESENGVAVRIFGMKQDITEEKILGDRTRYLADFDILTGLANRSQFQSKFSGMCECGTGRGQQLGALLLIDLDGFKQVNDTFGHQTGDECLAEAAARLKSACGGEELVARIGGDEFAVLLGSHLGLGDIAEVAKRVVEALGWPVELQGFSHKLGASVGVALNAACTPSQLFKRADTALYAAKAAGRNTFRIFKPDFEESPSARLTAAA